MDPKPVDLGLTRTRGLADVRAGRPKEWGDRMTRRWFLVPVLAAAILAGGCEATGPEPTEPPQTAGPVLVGGPVVVPSGVPGSTAGAGTSVAVPVAVASPPPEASPAVSVAGKNTQIKGVGNGTSNQFALTGTMEMTTSTCQSNGIPPFVWLYQASGALSSQIVQSPFELDNLKGKYYVTIATNPDCAWTIDIKPK
jgi:hypothetical protein